MIIFKYLTFCNQNKGLFLGMSFLTFFEPIEAVIKTLQILVKKNLKSKSTVNVSNNIEVKPKVIDVSPVPVSIDNGHLVIKTQ